MTTAIIAAPRGDDYRQRLHDELILYGPFTVVHIS